MELTAKQDVFYSLVNKFSSPVDLANFIYKVDSWYCSWDYTADLLYKLLYLIFSDFKVDFHSEDKMLLRETSEEEGDESGLFLLDLMAFISNKEYLKEYNEEDSEEDYLWHVENAARVKMNTK